MAELMLGQPLFPGESGIDQLVEIIKVLGTPTREQIRTMNPNYMEHKFPQIKPHPFNKVSLLLNILYASLTRLIGSCPFCRSSDVLLTRLSNLFQRCWSTRRHSVCQPSKPCVTPSLMNYETQIPVYLTPGIQTIRHVNCPTSLIFLAMVRNFLSSL